MVSEVMLMKVFAYRVFDLRDRFPQPFNTVLQALQALYSDEAYLADEFGELVAYCLDGSQIEIPRSLFTIVRPRFDSEADARDWVANRIAEIEHGGDRISIFGALISDSSDSFEKQIADAMESKLVELNQGIPLQDIATEIERWLEEKLNAESVHIAS